MLEEIHNQSVGIGRLELDVRTVGHAQTNRAGRSGPMKTSGYRKSPSARICMRKGIWKAAMRWKEART